jgi:hypothetical protein
MKMVLKYAGWEGVHWISLAEERTKRQAVVRMVMKLRVS